MRVNGEWYESDEGIVRPLIRADVLAADGSWRSAEFLVDTGADRTVLTAGLLTALRLQPLPTVDQLGGLGGVAQSVLVRTQIRMTRDDGIPVVFRGEYAAVTAPEALDMSVLGRDITDLFAVVVDRPGNVICLLGQSHRYHITQ
jgi:predicted aspartyl protease